MFEYNEPIEPTDPIEPTEPIEPTDILSCALYRINLYLICHRACFNLNLS